MSKPKIVFLIPRLGIVDRGAEIFVYELVKRLSQTFTITLYTRWSVSFSPLLVELQSLGIEIIRLHTPGTYAALSKLLEKPKHLWYFLQKMHLTPDEIEMFVFSFVCLPSLLLNNYDLLFPVNGIWGALVCSLVRFIKRIPFVYSAQGGIEPIIAFLHPNLYFVLHTKTKRWLVEHFPKLIIMYTPSGVDVNRFQPHGPKLTLHLKPPVILTVAALIPQKAIDRSIRAVAKLKQGSLLILGTGPLREELNLLAKKLLGDKRFKIIQVPHNEIQDYYRSCNIFTLPTKYEQFGLVYLEALATNLPVVGNKEDHLKHLISRAGVLCDTADTNAYSNALRFALHKKWAGLPRQQALKFTWEKVAGNYAKGLQLTLRRH